jgi:methionine-rich copper-binding protein CopC
MCATVLVGAFTFGTSQAKDGLYAISEAKNSAPPPKGLSLDLISKFKLVDLDVGFIRAHQNIAASALDDFGSGYELTLRENDTPQAKAAKAAYSNVRSQLLQSLQSVGAGINNGEANEAVQAQLLALSGQAFEAASVAYLSEFLETETQQTDILAADAGSGNVFIHHVKKNLNSTLQSAAQGLMTDILSTAISGNADGGQVLEQQIDSFILESARSFIDAGLATARRSDLYALRHLELEYNINDLENSYFSALVTQPIYQSFGLRHNVFLQGSAIANEKSVGIDEDDQARHTLNIGAAYRYLTVDEKYLFGGSVFFDHQWPYNHSRLGVGFDAKAQNLNFAANYYHPITDYRDSRRDELGNEYEERALRGYDLELGYNLPFLPELSVFGKGYQYFRNTDDDLVGAELRAEYRVNKSFTVKGALIEENGGRDGLELGLQYSTPLYNVDAPNLVLASIKTAAGEPSMRSKIFEKVRRENRIRVEERIKGNAGAAVLTSQFNALSTGLPFDVGGNATGAGVNLPFDTAITVPNGDFGIINFSNGAIANISASVAGDVILEFNATTLTVTTTNGGFVQFISGSGGINVVNVPGGTVNLLGTDIDVTDDGVTTTVQVRAGLVDVVPDVGVMALNGNQSDVVSLTMASGATSFLVNPALETRQEAAFTNLDLINPDTPDTATAAPFINALPTLITGPQFAGNNADIQFVFSQPVNVTGAPFVNGSVDANARTFTYNAAASTTTQLVFRHVFVAGDVNATNVTMNDIDLNGGTITSASNSLNAITAFTDTTVLINDTTAPSLSSSSPVDDEAAFSTLADIVLHFDENIQAGTGNIIITDTSDGSDNRTIAIADAQVNIAGVVLTLDPSTNLELATNYDITIAAGVIEDSNGNDFYGITTGNLNFTTTSDITPPLLTSSTPSDNAKEVARTANIVLNFNENVAIGTGDIIIRRTVDDALLETIAVGSANVTGGGTSSITINPTNNLPAATEVYLLIDAGAFTDLASNAYAGISSTTALSLRTFSPLDVAGVVLWLDGLDVNADGSNPANGAAVNVWNDKGPNNTDISGTGAATYSAAGEGLEFANTQRPFDDTYTRSGANNTLAAFIVSTLGASGNSVLIETANPRIAPGRQAFLGGGTNLSNNNNWVNTPLIGKQLLSFEYRSDGSALAYEDATQTLSVPGAISVSASPRLTIGDDTTGGNRMIAGEFMHSIIIYNADLSAVDRQRIEGFLAHKWGIDGNLPGGHPFYAVPP